LDDPPGAAARRELGNLLRQRVVGRAFGGVEGGGHLFRRHFEECFEFQGEIFLDIRPLVGSGLDRPLAVVANGAGRAASLVAWIAV